MTDNRTTELRISEPLRGFIRHQSNRAYIDGGQARWLTKIADEIDAKHEQAVAATLGTEYHGYEQAAIEAWESIKAWNARATYGTLTAEQVRGAIYDCSAYASYNGCTLHASGIRLQAITDTLNETLGGGECEVFASYDTSDVDSRNSNAEWYFAFTCGHELYWDEPEPPNFCPTCGFKIRKAVKR